MKIKILFLKKSAFLCCLFMLLVSYGRVSAQIIYTDIIPDHTPNVSYSLDLNNDSIVDFIIQMGGSNTVMCYPQNSNAYSGEFIAGKSLPWALSLSDSICASLVTWYTSSNSGTMALGTTVGNWIGVTDKYLPLKLLVGTNTYYGWARLDVSGTSSSFTIKDYAYESMPNAGILSGQMPTGMNESIVNHNTFSIFPNPFSTQTMLRTDNFLHNATLTMKNCLGQTVTEIKNMFGKTVTISRNNLPSGPYFIQLTEGNQRIITHKLVITD